MIGSGPPPATAADFHRDGCADLAIGVEWEAVNSDARAGAVNVLYGTAGGISADGSQIRTQDDLFTGDGSEPYEFFGQVLAAGDFDDDNYVDLAVGIPEEGIGTSGNAGAVQILYGSANGIAVVGTQFWHQDSFGDGYAVEDVAEPDDHFGCALAAIPLTRFRVYLPLVLNRN